MPAQHAVWVIWDLVVIAECDATAVQVRQGCLPSVKESNQCTLRAQTGQWEGEGGQGVIWREKASYSPAISTPVTNQQHILAKLVRKSSIVGCHPRQVSIMRQCRGWQSRQHGGQPMICAP